MRRHAKWVREAYGVRDVDRPSGLNAGLLLSEQRLFADSTSSLGLLLADMLATVLRRALNNRLQSTGWESYGRLLLADKSSTPILQLGPAPQSGRTQILKGQRIEKVWRSQFRQQTDARAPKGLVSSEVIVHTQPTDPIHTPNPRRSP